MKSWELLARESIRDLVARYNANGDSGYDDGNQPGDKPHDSLP